MSVVVYTDGACKRNPGPGGWAWVVSDGPFASGAEARTTNQRMEIVAALEAVRAHRGPVEIVSDSTYVVNCFRDRWWEGWIQRGWTTTAKKPVANRDLWEPLIDLYRERGDVTFRWVKGHSGDPGNDQADQLAVEAAATQQARSGDRPPKVLAPTNAGPADAKSAGVAPPQGHLLLVVGHRPPELGGYGPNPTAQALQSKLAEILTAKAQIEPDLVVMTGLQLGAEQIAAEAALAEGIPFAAIVPFPDPEARWPEASRTHYRELVDAAASVVRLESKPPETARKVGAALSRRDAWLARSAHEAVIVWDGADAALGRLFRTLEEHLGAEVWLLNPRDL